MTKILKTIGAFFFVTYMLSVCSWLLTYIYTSWCTPRDMIGIMTMPLTVGSPVCQTILKIQYSIGEYYTTFWISLGMTIVTWIDKNTN